MMNLPYPSSEMILYLIQLSETAKNNCLDKELGQNALQTDKN